MAFDRLILHGYAGMLAGMTTLFIYLLPDKEGMVAMLGVVISIWQGILLLKAEPGETQAPEINASQPYQG